MNLIQKTLLLAALTSASAFAVPITISSGNPGNAGTDNVLFNVIGGDGPLVQGTFSGNPGFTVNFTSAGGNLTGSGGQAVLIAGTGNNPFNDVTVSLDANATFTKAILNINAISSGNVKFTVSYIDSTGSPFTEIWALGQAGNNFFGVVADEGAKITSINVNSTDTTFDNIKQWRLGGFADATTVPDGGATVALLGLGSLALAAFRRKA